MKLSLSAVVLLLACTNAVLGENHWPMNLQGLLAAQGHRLIKRQADGSCTDDIAQTSTQKFLTCSSELGTIQGQDPSASDSDIEDFCTQECGPYLLDLTSKLAKDCGIPDAKPDINTERYVNATCKHGINNKLCGLLWKDVVANPSTTDYFSCLAQFDPNEPCPDVCKTAEQWINSNVGCCYHAYSDYLTSQGVTGVAFTDEFWTSCGVKEPTDCKT